jgi:hypothetical protein
MVSNPVPPLPIRSWPLIVQVEPAPATVTVPIGSWKKLAIDALLLETLPPASILSVPVRKFHSSRNLGLAELVDVSLAAANCGEPRPSVPGPERVTVLAGRLRQRA